MLKDQPKTSRFALAEIMDKIEKYEKELYIYFPYHLPEGSQVLQITFQKTFGKVQIVVHYEMENGRIKTIRKPFDPTIADLLKKSMDQQKKQATIQKHTNQFLNGVVQLSEASRRTPEEMDQQKVDQIRSAVDFFKQQFSRIERILVEQRASALFTKEQWIMLQQYDEQILQKAQELGISFPKEQPYKVPTLGKLLSSKLKDPNDIEYFFTLRDYLCEKKQRLNPSHEERWTPDEKFECAYREFIKCRLGEYMLSQLLDSTGEKTNRTIIQIDQQHKRKSRQLLDKVCLGQKLTEQELCDFLEERIHASYGKATVTEFRKGYLLQETKQYVQALSELETIYPEKEKQIVSNLKWYGEWKELLNLMYTNDPELKVLLWEKYNALVTKENQRALRFLANIQDAPEREEFEEQYQMLESGLRYLEDTPAFGTFQLSGEMRQHLCDVKLLRSTVQLAKFTTKPLTEGFLGKNVFGYQNTIQSYFDVYQYLNTVETVDSSPMPLYAVHRYLEKQLTQFEEHTPKEWMKRIQTDQFIIPKK